METVIGNGADPEDDIFALLKFNSNGEVIKQ
jgi:hypothetical protein